MPSDDLWRVMRVFVYAAAIVGSITLVLIVRRFPTGAFGSFLPSLRRFAWGALAVSIAWSLGRLLVDELRGGSASGDHLHYMIWGGMAAGFAVFMLVMAWFDFHGRDSTMAATRAAGFEPQPAEAVPLSLMAGAGVLSALLGFDHVSAERAFRRAAPDGERWFFGLRFAELEGQENTHSVFAYCSERPRAPFELHPAGFLERVLSDGLAFDTHPGFSRRYSLHTHDEPAIRKLFRPELLRFFEAHPGWHVEAAGQWLVVHRANVVMRSFEPDPAGFLALAETIRRALDGSVEGARRV